MSGDGAGNELATAVAGAAADSGAAGVLEAQPVNTRSRRHRADNDNENRLFIFTTS
jgi:hypothetical protein